MSILSEFLNKQARERQRKDLSQQDYLRKFQSDEAEERRMARLHLPPAYVFCDDMRLTGSDFDSTARKRQAAFYELGKLVGHHPRFDTPRNLEAMLERNECPPVLYDGTGTAPNENWVLPKGSIEAKMSGKWDTFRIVYRGELNNEMKEDLADAIARSTRMKATYVLDRLGLPSYETELPSAVWEMSGRNEEKSVVYELLMDGAPEDDEGERRRYVTYGLTTRELLSHPGKLGTLAMMCAHVEAWLDVDKIVKDDEDDIPLYDAVLRRLYFEMEIEKRFARYSEGTEWKEIWTGAAPQREIADTWRF